MKFMARAKAKAAPVVQQEPSSEEPAEDEQPLGSGSEEGNDQLQPYDDDILPDEFDGEGDDDEGSDGEGGEGESDGDEEEDGDEEKEDGGEAVGGEDEVSGSGSDDEGDEAVAGAGPRSSAPAPTLGKRQAIAEAQLRDAKRLHAQQMQDGSGGDGAGSGEDEDSGDADDDIASSSDLSDADADADAVLKDGKDAQGRHGSRGLAAGQHSHSDDEGDEEDSELDDERRASGASAGGKFTEGAKGASFAKAFAKILAKAPKAKAAEAADGEAVPILAGSKTIARRAAEDQALSEARAEARRARSERRSRGHASVPRRGEDPGHDLLEKGLGKLATKGVVMLFNAIAKAQKVAKDASAGGLSGAKAVKLNKVSFLAQLKSGTATGAAGQEDADAGNWKVLKKDYTGLSGGSKMKDWDREQAVNSDEEHMGAPGADGSSSEEGGGDAGW